MEKKLRRKITIRLAIVIFENVDKVDIKDVKIVDFDYSENLGYGEDIHDYVECILCFEYGIRHGIFF